MAESQDQQTPANTQRTRTERLAQWSVGQMASLVLSSFFGSTAGLLAVLQADIFGLSKNIEKIDTAIVELTKQQEVHRTTTAPTTKIDKIDNALSELKTEIRRVSGETSTALQDHESHRDEIASLSTALSERIRSSVTTVGRDFSRVSQQVGESKNDILSGQRRTEQALLQRISELEGQLASVHRAFVKEMATLVEDGRNVVADFEKAPEGNDEAVARWIARANYMVRSLVIPTEMRVIRESSVVKDELRKAMAGFAKAQDYKEKMVHASKVLLIVEAVRDLAEGGRIS